VPELDELIAAMELGKEAQEFIEGNIGRYLIGVAQQEVRAAQEALGRVQPEDIKTIVELQRKVWNGEHFEEWLKELVHNGNEAEIAYKQLRS
jgi:hypothetical protein